MTPGGKRVFHVKICGVTTAADAEMVAAAGADAIGLNFVQGSPRQLDLADGREVAAAIPAGVLRVGVFAGSPVDDMLQIARRFRQEVQGPDNLGDGQRRDSFQLQLHHRLRLIKRAFRQLNDAQIDAFRRQPRDVQPRTPERTP